MRTKTGARWQAPLRLHTLHNIVEADGVRFHTRFRNSYVDSHLP